MNSDAYKTAAGRLHSVDELKRKINAGISLGQGVRTTNTCPYAADEIWASDAVMMVLGDSGVNGFNHPIEIERHGEKTIVVDMRGYTRRDRDGKVVPTSKSEYNFQLGRAFLTSIAANDRGTSLLNFSDAPVKIFARWLTDRLNTQLHMELEDQIAVKACAAWFYICQFYDADDFGKEEHNRTKARAMRNVAMDGRQWDSVMGKEDLPWTGTIDLFCELVKKVTGNSVRTDGLDRRFVTEVTIGSWRGAQGREVVAVGLEHPPTWIAMLQLCVEESSYYKRMPLGETVERALKNRADKDAFLVSIARLPY